MSDTTTLVRALENELRDLEKQIRSHAYLQAIDNARIPRERLKFFAGEQYHIISSDLRSVALMLARFGDTSHDFFKRFLEGEKTALDALAPFGAALGINDAHLAAWGENCERMSRALREKYGFNFAQVGFFDFFAMPAPEFNRGARAAIDRGLIAGVSETLIRRAARMLQGYELMFWDTLLKISTAG